MPQLNPGKQQVYLHTLMHTDPGPQHLSITTSIYAFLYKTPSGNLHVRIKQEREPSSARGPTQQYRTPIILQFEEPTTSSMGLICNFSLRYTLGSLQIEQMALISAHTNMYIYIYMYTYIVYCREKSQNKPMKPFQEIIGLHTSMMQQDRTDS